MKIVIFDSKLLHFARGQIIQTYPNQHLWLISKIEIIQCIKFVLAVRSSPPSGKKKRDIFFHIHHSEMDLPFFQLSSIYHGGSYIATLDYHRV